MYKKSLSPSSKRWIQRSLSDSYTKQAVKKGLRSRSYFKICDIDKKCRFFVNEGSVLDLGSAPGGWSYFASRNENVTHTVALDILPMQSLAKVSFFRRDFLEESCNSFIQKSQWYPFSYVLSDIAPSKTGNCIIDAVNIELIENTLINRIDTYIERGGSFLMKTFDSDRSAGLKKKLVPLFRRVLLFRSSVTHRLSSEIYIVCQGYKRRIV